MRTRLWVAALVLCSACSPREQAEADAGSPLATDTMTPNPDTLPTALDSQSGDQHSSDGLDSVSQDGDLLDDDLPDGTFSDGQLYNGQGDAEIGDGAAVDAFADAGGSVDTAGADVGADSGQDGGKADVPGTFVYPKASYNSAPAVKVYPWPPPCKNPKFIEYGQSNSVCWELPEHWCKGGGDPDAIITPACSADGTQCCALMNDSCLPCGWVDCFGVCGFKDTTLPPNPKCPPQCRNQPSPWKGKDAKLWYSPACQLLAKVLAPPYAGGSKVDSCGICGTEVYCKWKKP